MPIGSAFPLIYEVPSGKEPVVPSAAPAATWATRYSEDYEGGALTSVQNIGGPAWSRANITSPVITGGRSFQVSSTDWPANAVVGPFWTLADLKASAQNVRRFRTGLKLRATSVATTVLVGVRRNDAPFGYAAYARVPLTTGVTTVVFDYIWPFPSTGELRVDLTEASSIIIDDVLHEEDTSFSGFLGANVGAVLPELMGVHFNQAHVGGHVSGPDVDYMLVRGWEIPAWRFSEPAVKGTYNWVYTDAHAQLCLEHNAKYMHVCAYTPNWATSNTGGGSTGGVYPGSNLLPVNVNDAIDFLTAARARINGIAPGAFRYVELWNEADLTQFLSGATPAQVVAFCQAMYNAIKALDSSIVVIAPNVGAGSGIRFFDELLAAGIDQYCDAYSIHQYFWVGFKSQITHAFNYRQALTRRGVSVAKPIYMTEGSPNELNNPGDFAAGVCAAVAAGIKLIAYYTLEGIFDPGTALAGPPSTLATNTALGDEYNAVGAWLAGHTLVEAYAANRVWHMVLTRPGGGTRVVLWTDGPVKRIKGLSAWDVTTLHRLTGQTQALRIDEQQRPMIPVSTIPVMLDDGTPDNNELLAGVAVAQAAASSAASIAKRPAGAAQGQASGSGSLNASGGDFWELPSDPEASGAVVFWSKFSWGYLDDALVAAGVDAGKVDVGSATSIEQSDLPGIGNGTRYLNRRSYGAAGNTVLGPWTAEVQVTAT